MTRKEWKTTGTGRVIAILILMIAIFLRAGQVEDEKYFMALLILVPVLFFVVWERVMRYKRDLK